jgi:hypothetical protein
MLSGRWPVVVDHRFDQGPWQKQTTTTNTDTMKTASKIALMTVILGLVGLLIQKARAEYTFFYYTDCETIKATGAGVQNPGESSSAGYETAKLRAKKNASANLEDNCYRQKADECLYPAIKPDSVTFRVIKSQYSIALYGGWKVWVEATGEGCCYVSETVY